MWTTVRTPHDDANDTEPTLRTIIVSLLSSMSLSTVVQLTIQYRGARARAIQHIPPSDRDENVEWEKTLRDFDYIEFRHQEFKPTDHEVVWQYGRIIVSWHFASDSVRVLLYLRRAFLADHNHPSEG